MARRKSLGKQPLEIERRPLKDGSSQEVIIRINNPNLDPNFDLFGIVQALIGENDPVAEFLDDIESKDLSVFDDWMFPQLGYMYGWLVYGLIGYKVFPREITNLLIKRFFEHIESSSKFHFNIPSLGQFFLAITDLTIGDLGGMRQIGLTFAERVNENKHSYFTFGLTVHHLESVWQIYRRKAYALPKPDYVYLYLKNWDYAEIHALIKKLASSTFLIPNLDENTRQIVKNYRNTMLIDPVLPDAVEVSTYLRNNKPELFSDNRWEHDPIYSAGDTAVDLLHRGIQKGVELDDHEAVLVDHWFFRDTKTGLLRLRKATLGENL